MKNKLNQFFGKFGKLLWVLGVAIILTALVLFTVGSTSNDFPVGARTGEAETSATTNVATTESKGTTTATTTTITTTTTQTTTTTTKIPTTVATTRPTTKATTKATTATTKTPTTAATTKATEPVSYSWNGSVLTAEKGVNYGPTGKETWYDLDMTWVISYMRQLGYTGDYWIRDDGCKMLGSYIMCAANLDVFPRGTLVESSLGTCIVCDTGGFAANNPYQLDIATDWS